MKNMMKKMLAALAVLAVIVSITVHDSSAFMRNNSGISIAGFEQEDWDDDSNRD